MSAIRHRSWALAACIAASALAPRLAVACDQAEKLRLTDEQKKLAARNAWTGVERQYELLQITKCELSYDNLYLGAESARFLGKVYDEYERLKAALSVAPAKDAEGNDPSPGIIDSLEAIDRSYARVEIHGDARRRPVLSRPELPFAPDQRKAVEWAQTVVAETGSFKGMLPFGAYVVGSDAFTVEASPDFLVIEVGKGKSVAKAPAPTGDSDGGSATTTTDTVGGTDTQSTFRYAGLVLVAGPGLITTPASSKPVLLDDGGHAFAPASETLSGLGAELGVELGLTYAEPAIGLALGLGYHGGYGTSTFHALSAWGALTIRPGHLRLAAGPMYQVDVGRGTGVADWFDRGQDASVDPVDTIPYEGIGYGGGAKAAIGYGLLDLEPLEGIVEIGGAWQSDGSRNYFTVALRVGLVPKVPRFEG